MPRVLHVEPCPELISQFRRLFVLNEVTAAIEKNQPRSADAIGDLLRKRRRADLVVRTADDQGWTANGGEMRMAIWGNHGIRASVTAMQDVYRRILEDGGLQDVDKDIVPVGEIFRLQDMDRVKEIEGRFLK